MSQSVSSAIGLTSGLQRQESSDSGGVSMYHDGSEVSVPVLGPVSDIIDSVEKQLENDNWSERSELYPESEESNRIKIKSITATATSYQIADNLLDQERTALRDLKLLSQSFYNRISEQLVNCRILSEMFLTLAELRKSQEIFVEELALLCKIADRIGEVPSRMLCWAHNSIPQYSMLLQQYPIYISALDELARTNKTFRNEISAFESSDECYMPINWLLLKIVGKIVLWQPILAGIVEHHLEDGREEKELTSARVALDKVSQYSEKTFIQREALAGFVTLLQIEAELGRTVLLSNPNRKPIRVGWIERWGQAGPNKRIMLLTTDRLLFAYRSPGDIPFTVYADVKLKGMMIDDGDTYKISGRNEDVFTIHAEGRSIVLASPAKTDWIEDISNAIKAAAKTRIELPPLQLDAKEEHDIDSIQRSKLDAEGSRYKGLLQICWHRKASLGVSDMNKMASCSHSGYLLRKLRSSAGWQRLWVVLSGHTLYFYKSHQDSAPLANLPLVEYSVGVPSLEDNVHYEKCFKLHYAQYKYFFRADCQYSFRSWMKAIRSCAISTKPLDMITALSLRI